MQNQPPGPCAPDHSTSPSTGETQTDRNRGVGQHISFCFLLCSNSKHTFRHVQQRASRHLNTFRSTAGIASIRDPLLKKSPASTWPWSARREHARNSISLSECKQTIAAWSLSLSRVRCLKIINLRSPGLSGARTLPPAKARRIEVTDPFDA